MSASKLSDYEKKRDFQKTAEPKGDDPVKPSAALRFVIQRHDARRLHYDLRLELNGVFKSWAVTKGPSLNPVDKRLAVEVEDHPLGYGDFEGTIPQGQYGGGTVQLFDRGTWAPEGSTPPAKALEAGELKFSLSGKRLKGSFVLVRLKHDRSRGKRTNWLLIKHRDEAANDQEDGGGIPAIETSVASGRTLAMIATGKGRRPKPFMLPDAQAPARDAVCNSSEGLAQKERATSPARKPAIKASRARKKAPSENTEMPEFVAPQFCSVVTSPPSGSGWLHEIKFDGYRAQIRVEAGTAIIRTRNGHDWTGRFRGLAKAAEGLADAMLDGEIVALDHEGNPSFSALQAAIAAEKTDDLTFFAFDLLFHEGVDLRPRPLLERKAALAAFLPKRLRRFRYVEHFDASGASVFASAKDLGLEGIVSKKATAPYKSGRTESWTKTKIRVGHEVVLGAWTETNGRFRSLLGGVFRDGSLAYVGRIGTGYSAEIVKNLMPSLKAHAAARSPFASKGGPPRDRSVHWLEPTLVAEVEFAGWSSDGLVRQAAFKGLRIDKDAAQVEAEKPVAKTIVKSPPQRSNVSTKVTVMGVALTHPDKPLWPDAGDERPVTKADLAHYFEAVGAWMLPHLEGRPCSIIRAPDGIAGQTFFQRHLMAGASKLFDTLMIDGDREPYLVINDIAALAAVAQSGGVELHPLNCVPNLTDVPGRLVFDLDPAPDVAFSTVISAAKTMKALLEELGLSTFCKTTGGKGLHVVVPLLSPGGRAMSKSARSKKSRSEPTDWAEAKQFAHDVCLAIERAEPKKYLTKMSKAARTGRIFLDYLRNDRLSTAVAPLSPRARPHAPVSMPLTWSQVKADLDPMRYTLRTVPSLLARSKAWADYDDAAKPLSDAIQALATL